MKLKMRTAGMIGFAMAAFILLLFLFIRPVLLEDAKLMDEESLNIDRERVRSYIEAETLDLKRLNRDWAIWDDTYKFIQDQNSGYINSNLMPETFENNANNFMVFINNSGQVIYSEGYNLETGEQLNLMNAFPDIPETVSYIKQQEGTAIIKNNELGHIVMAGNEVLTSEEEGPAAGYLLMGNVMDVAFFEKMREVLAINFEITENKTADLTIQELDNHTISGMVSIDNELTLEVKKSVNIISRNQEVQQIYFGLCHLPVYFWFF